MKKRFISSFVEAKFLIARCLTLLILALLSTNLAWGAEITFNPANDKTFPKDGITISVTDGTLTNGTDYRVYKNQTMTISSTVGNITKIEFTYSSASYDGGGWASTYTPNAASWTSPTANGEQARITQIKVTTAGSSKTLTSIAISGTPNKTTYETGEEFDPAGLKVMGTYEGQTDPEEITSGITWTFDPAKFTSTSQTSVSVTATIDGKSDTKNYTVTVTEHVVTPGTYEIVPNNTFFGVEVQTTGRHDAVTGKQNDITITHSGGSSFYCNATQVRTYKDNTLTFSVPARYEITSIVLAVTDNASFSADKGTYTASSKTWAGNAQQVVLTSGQSSGNYQITKITVTYEAKKTLTSIAVKTAPTKVIYNVGETFAPAGLVITATYDDTSTEDIAYTGNEDKFSFSPTLDAALATTDEKVTITYGGKSCNQDITVNLIKLATPTNLNATPASTSATLTWDAVEHASSYEVKVMDGDSYNETFTPTTNTLLVEGLTASTEYLWSVKAIGDNVTYSDGDANEDGDFTTSALPTVAYTVTFSGNGHGTPASESIEESSAGAGVTLPNCTPNAGYQFVGWATSETATEAEYEAGATYYPIENITLYAVYDKVFTINYMVNGVNTDAQENVKEGTPLVFPTVTAPDADHVFCGWVTTAIEGTQPTAPEYVNTTGLTASENITYYAVFAERSGSEPAEQKTQTLQYDTWTYSGSTTDKSSYRLFHSGSYIESAEFDLSKLTKVIVYGGTFGGGSYNSLTIGDGTNTWKSVTVSGNSENGENEYKDGTTLSGTGKLRITSNSGSSTGNGTGVRISKVEIFTMEGGYTYTNYCTTVVTKTLTSISLSGNYPTEFWKGETFSHEGMIVTAHYNDGSTKDVTASATFTGYDMASAGEQTVTITYDTKSTTYNITVKTIANTPATAYTVAEAKTIIDANPAELATTEVYVKGTVSKIVTAWDSQYNNITYNISEDGETTSQQFQLFRCVTGGAIVGEYVIAKGKMTNYKGTYELSAGNTIVNAANIAITAAKWGTFCAPFAVTIPEGVKAYTATADGNNVAFAEVTTTIPVGTPVVVYSATEVVKNYFGALATGETCTYGALVGVYAATSGITADANHTNYVLQNNAQGVGFYKATSTISLKANRCYMKLPTSANAKDCIGLDDAVTGINEILNPTKKSVEGIYDLNGRKLAAPQKGINIINGVKVIVK